MQNMAAILLCKTPNIKWPTKLRRILFKITRLLMFFFCGFSPGSARSSLSYTQNITLLQKKFFLSPTIYWVSYFIKYSTVQYNNIGGDCRADDVVAASPLGFTSKRLLLLTSWVCRSSRSSICFVLLLTSGYAGVTAASNVGQTLG